MDLDARSASSSGEEEPEPAQRFHRRIWLPDTIRELWGTRALIQTLVEREWRAYYKRTILGVAWAVITPLTLMVVFTIFIRRVGAIDTGNVPYPLFAYIGLVPWTFFSGAVSRAGLSLLQNSAILNKIYCPREIFPLAGIALVAIDTGIAALVLVVLFVVMGVAPKATSVFVPVLLLVQLAFTVGVTLFVSAAVVYVRDIRHILPLLLQLALFATPVAYGIGVVPKPYLALYATLNPLAPVIEGYRDAILFGRWPSWGLLLPAAVAALVWLVAGYVVFKYLEVGFADVA